MAWREELTALATERGAALVGYAYLLCGDLPRAHDLVQEGLARSWARPGQARGRQAAEAYVRRAVLHAFLDEYRRERVWRGRRHLAAVPDVVPDAGRRTDDELEVQQALAVLPPRERACVVLRFYEDLTVPALADRLGISEGAAKRYLSDALGRLEAALGPVAPPAGTGDDGHDGGFEIRLTGGGRDA